VLVALASMIIGVAVGSAAGYFGGWIDSLMSRVTDIFFAIPFLLGAIVILISLQSRNVFTVSFAIAVLSWPVLTRLMRSSVLSVRNQDYVMAAKALGAGTPRILGRHVMPNAIAPVITFTTVTIGSAISLEATLTFLGVGLEPPAISWGLQISNAQNYVLSTPHLLLFPGLFLSLTVLGFLLLGDALAEALDPKLR
jgi:oligopeptide transport system permease protein